MGNNFEKNVRARRAVPLLGSLILLLLLGVPAAAEPPSGFAPAEFQYHDGKVFYGRSYLENLEGMQVLHLYGTPFEMGYAHTKLMAYRYPEAKEKVLGDLIPPVPAGILGQLIMDIYVDIKARQLDPYLPPEIRGEIQGLAEPYIIYGGSYSYAVFFQALYDIYKDLTNGGCTGFVAQGQATADGKIYLARNFDFAKKGTFDDFKLIIFRHPHKGYAYVSVAWLTMIGVVSGMNEKGLTLALHSANGKDTASRGLPANLMVAYILQKAATVKEAEAIVRNTPSMGTYILLAADAQGDAAAIEFSAKKVGVRRDNPGAQSRQGGMPLMATNHYLTPELAPDPQNQPRTKYGDSRYRWERLNSLLSANQGQIDPSHCAKILRDRLDILGRKLPLGDENAVNPAHNSYSVIFCPSDISFWVARAPMAWGEYRGFSFNKNAGAQDFVPLPANIPADPYIFTPEYQKELWSYDYLEKARLVAKLGYEREVEDLARRSLLMEPENYRARKFLALWLASKGEYQKALENTAFMVYQTMGVPEEKALTHAYRGMLQDLLGNREEALREYKIALEYDASPLANQLAKKGMKESYKSFTEK